MNGGKESRAYATQTLRSTQLRFASLVKMRWYSSSSPRILRCLESSGFCHAHSNCRFVQYLETAITSLLPYLKGRQFTREPVYDHLHLPWAMTGCRPSSLRELSIVLPKSPWRIWCGPNVGSVGVSRSLGPQQIASIKGGENVIAIEQCRPCFLIGRLFCVAGHRTESIRTKHYVLARTQ